MYPWKHRDQLGKKELATVFNGLAVGFSEHNTAKHTASSTCAHYYTMVQYGNPEEKGVPVDDHTARIMLPLIYSSSPTTCAWQHARLVMQAKTPTYND